MRLLAASDLHADLAAAQALVDAAPAADLVLIAGDLADSFEGLEPLMEVLAPLGAKAILVPGNNESVEQLRAATALTVLHGERVERAGITIIGHGGSVPPLPAELPFASWNVTEAEAALAPFTACDLLLTHAPPKGIADRFGAYGSIGSTAYRAAVERLQPRLMLFGHVHPCWGEEGQIGRTRCRNLGPAPSWLDL